MEKEYRNPFGESCPTERPDRCSGKNDEGDPPGRIPSTGSVLLKAAAELDQVDALERELAARAESAEALAKRCATYSELRGHLPYLELNLQRMWHRIGPTSRGTRISPLEHRIYGVVRRACWLRRDDGDRFAGAFISHREMAMLLGCDKTSVAKAVAELVALDVLRVVPQYRPADEVLRRLDYAHARAQIRNAYVLGGAALDPHGDPAKRKRRRRPVDSPGKNRGKTPSLPNPEQGGDEVSPLENRTRDAGARVDQTAVAASPRSGSGSSLRDEERARGGSRGEGSGSERAQHVPRELDEDASSFAEIADALGMGPRARALLLGEVSP